METIYLIKCKLFCLLLLLVVVSSPSFGYQKSKNDIDLTPTQMPLDSQIPTRVSNSFIIHVQVDSKNNREFLKNEVNTLARKFQVEMKKSNIMFRFIYIYYLALQGFYIKLQNPEQILDIETMELSYILSIEPDSEVQLMNHQILGTFPQQAMNVPSRIVHQAVNADGVKVAIIDQGIKHADKPFLSPNKICNQIVREGCRVKKIYDILKFYRSNDEWYVFYSVDIAESLNWDSLPVYGSHGTIVASLLGGTDAVAPGIAQGVEFYDYRAFPSNGKTAFGVGMLGIEMAILDDVDIIFISFGRPGNLRGRPRTSLFKKDGKNEILLITANGNEGDKGWPFQLSNMAQFENSISVGSVDNPVQQAFSISFEEVHLNYGAELLGVFELTWIAPPSNFFDILNANRKRGAIFLNSEWKYMGQRSFIDSNDHALTFIVCNDSDDCQVQFLFAFAEKKFPSILIFVSISTIDVSPFQGSNILLGQISRLTFEFIEMVNLRTIYTFKFNNNFEINETKGLVPSSYTAMGPDALLNIKPTVSAIGGRVYAYFGTDENNRPKYLLVSGTSAAAAQVGGIVCGLVKQNGLQGKFTLLHEVLSSLVNTAKMYMYPVNPPNVNVPLFFKGFAHSMLQQGAGLVNARTMLDAKVYISPSSIAFSRASAPAQRARKTFRTVSMTNKGDRAVKYFIDHVPGLSLTYDADAHQYKHTNVAYSVEWQTTGLVNPLNTVSPEAFFKLDPFESQRITFLFKLPPSPLREPFTFYNGYIRLIPVIENDTVTNQIPEKNLNVLSIPYMVVYGDLDTFPVLNQLPTRKGFLTDATILRAPKKYLELKEPTYWLPMYRERTHDFPVFYFIGASKPVISLCFIYPLRSISFYLFDFFTSHKPKGFIAQFDHINANCYLFFAKPKPIFYGDELNDSSTMSYGSENSEGWSGTYFTSNRRDRKSNLITRGTFLICANILRQGQHMDRQNFDWCSSPFHAEIP